MKIGEIHLTEEQVNGYHRNSLGPEAVLAVSDHAADCAECRTRLVGNTGRLHRRNVFLDDGEPRFHLSYEQMRDHVKGGMDAFGQELVDAHVKVCTSCRNELEDLARFRAELLLAQVNQAEEEKGEKPAPPIRSREVWDPRPSWWERLTNWWDQFSASWMLYGGLAATAVIVALLVIPGMMGVGQHGDFVASSKTPEDSANGGGAKAKFGAPSSPRSPNGGEATAPFAAAVPPLPLVTLNDGADRYILAGESVEGLPSAWPTALKHDVEKILRGHKLAVLDLRPGPVDATYTLAQIKAISPNSHLALGLVLLKAEDRTGAKREFEMLAAENPHSRIVDQLLEEMNAMPK